MNEFSIYFWYQSLIIYIVCKYLLPFSRLPFHFVGFFCCSPIYLYFLDLAWGDIAEKILLRPISKCVLPMFSSTSFVILDLTFKFLQGGGDVTHFDIGLSNFFWRFYIHTHTHTHTDTLALVLAIVFGYLYLYSYDWCHIFMWQKPIQHCKAIIFQFKNLKVLIHFELFLICIKLSQHQLLRRLFSPLCTLASFE